MAALTADRNTRTKAGGTARHCKGKLAAGVVIFLGALIAKNAAGNIVPASDTAALVVVGIAEESISNSGGIAGAKEVEYVTGVTAEFVNAGGAIVLASSHGLCYVADDQSVTTAAVAVNDVKAGIVQEYSAAKVWVFVDETISV